MNTKAGEPAVKVSRQHAGQNLWPANPFLKGLLVLGGLAGSALVNVIILFIAGIIVLFIVSNNLAAFPTTRSLGNRYLKAVIAGDAERAARLYNAVDKHLMEDIALDIKLLKNAEIRHLEVRIQGPGGSDDTIQSAEMTFWYRKPGDSAWLKAHLSIVTSAVNLFQRRIVWIFARYEEILTAPRYVPGWPDGTR